ncbi:clostripain-related cysteine peptidase [Sphingobacterium humi]|uniref:Clostripain n=1 Tax=Sphingobacterium humi TaxID=1796905 RepID=A0A6N8KVG0_9SPHI|nr:clostripain-related cysteine peptidase [Sphingobacterium humi]MVZ60689.1 hypothetical protein [Sphingobacterium humi]
MYIRLFYFISLSFCLLSSCKKNEDPLLNESSSLTIVYLEANNNLRMEARKTINDLEKGVAISGNPKNTIIAYIKDNDSYGYLLKISPDNSAYNIISDTIKVFDWQDKSNAEHIKTVLNYISSEFQSDYYNLILWSHGTSWAPNLSDHSQFQPFSFGEDRGKQIDILDLKEALPMYFNYIIFDACSMASIEVLYEFRNKAKYIVASPTDILSDGFPYDQIIPFISGKNQEDVCKIADTYIQVYDKMEGLNKSASVSVTDMVKIDKIARYVKSINSKRANKYYKTNKVQRLDFTPGFPVPLYDFGDFIAENYSIDEHAEVKKILEEVIIYKNSTPSFLGNEVSTFSGMAISAPDNSSAYYDYYVNLGWNKNVEMFPYQN